MTTPCPSAPIARLVIAGLAWLACFWFLRAQATWVQFAIAAPGLAAAEILFDRRARALLRPSLGAIAVGFLVGLCMIAMTHGLFAMAAPHAPALRDATDSLFQLLRVDDYAPSILTVLIVAIASSEEVVFRGVIAGSGAGWRIGRSDQVRIVALAGWYALATATLASPLLVACAFAGGLVWGFLRVATGSVVAPAVAHVVWDLGVLVVWPLA